MATPAVLQLAASLGVDVGSVQGSGIGGRVTVEDVYTAVGQPAAVRAAQRSARISLAASRRTLASAQGAGDPAFARNPLVDQVRRTAPQRVAAAAAAGVSTPSLFAAGDLPSFTASGIPASALLEVPWQARHAMAAAQTTAEAYAIRDVCSGPEAADAAASEYGAHPGNVDYAARVDKWQMDSLTDADVYKAIGFEERDRALAEQRQRLTGEAS